VRLLPSLAVTALLAAVLGGCGGTTNSGDIDDATLVLDFTPNAVHVGIYTALARDFDGAEGVRMRVRPPSQSTDSVRLLTTGRADFAILSISDLALAREQGQDLVAVMAIVQRPLAALLARPGVRSPRDLEGERVGVTGLPSDVAVLDSIVRGDGGDPGKVRRTTIGFTAVPSLLSGRVEAATGFRNAEGVALRREPGRPFRIFRVEEYGAPPYPELVLVTTQTALQDDPDVAPGLVAALRRGYEEALLDPTWPSRTSCGATAASSAARCSRSCRRFRAPSAPAGASASSTPEGCAPGRDGPGASDSWSASPTSTTPSARGSPTRPRRARRTDLLAPLDHAEAAGEPRRCRSARTAGRHLRSSGADEEGRGRRLCSIRRKEARSA
jgi:NitT/TauT family transport system substrate-binding protein/putative hydroxymethylpyrimidine transport system substrate-binding protein